MIRAIYIQKFISSVHYSFIKKRRDFLLLMEKCIWMEHIVKTRVLTLHLESAIEKKKIKDYFHCKFLKLVRNSKKRYNLVRYKRQDVWNLPVL